MIRRATLDDVPAVLALWNEVIRDTTITFTATPKSPEHIEAIITQQPVFVPETTAGCVGFATFAQFRGGDGYAHTMEHAIYLSAKARGQGIGRALMDAVEKQARAAGTHSLIGGISAENEGGLAFHAAMGFVEVGRLPEVGRKFGRLLDLVLMQKIL